MRARNDGEGGLKFLFDVTLRKAVGDEDVVGADVFGTDDADVRLANASFDVQNFCLVLENF